MWEKLRKRVLEFIELKFVSVKRIRTRRAARFGVVFLVWRRDQKDAIGMKQPAGFR